jgi:predicted metalloprotease with PDZ domain
MDSPTKIGDLHITRWDISNPDGARFKMGIALESIATPEQENELAGKVRRMVAEAKAVYGEFPKYDYGTYTFLASINSYVHGDGMEHRNSTMITVPIPRLNVDRVLGVFAHEYFHNWNVERIRPKTLEPFNFTKSNMSNELWFAEGFTQYYGNLLLARAGLLPAENYLSILDNLINTKVNTPGARFYSPVQASNHAVFVDAGVSIDRNNYSNMFTSYYPYGAAIALALDIEMQTRYHKPLDAYMRAMWQRFGKTEIPYTLTTMQETLASVTDKSFAENFFQHYILGHDAPPYAELMHKAGYTLQLAKPGSAYIGARLQSSDGKLVISSNTQIGTPAYDAGLDINDELISIDGTPLHTPDDLNNWLQSHHPGESVTIQFRHRTTEQQASIKLAENPVLELVPAASAGAEAESIRKSWFATHTGN